MYALALLTSAGLAAAGLPYFHIGALDIGVPIQGFGMIVAVGVLVGATPLRRYAEWHGVSDDHIRGLLSWVIIAGFLGAHEFDVLAYQFDKIGDAAMVQPAGWWFLPAALWPSNWPLVFRIWDGISSYGGFIGGGIGFAIYVWWKRLPARLFADITIVGLLPAFTIGRIACTMVSDHIGAAADPSAWYSFLAMDYPRKLVEAAHDQTLPGTAEVIRAWNLGLLEFLYLVPVCAIVLTLAFRPSKRPPAGFLTVLTGVLYAPVRFFLEFLRPGHTDPPYWGLTFAQWSSLLAFGLALYVARRVLSTGKPAETVTRTSREAQERLKIILRDDEEAQKQQVADRQTEAERKKSEIAQARAERDREDAALAAEAAAAGKQAGADEASEDEADGADEAEAETEAEPEVAKAAAGAGAAKPAGARPAAKSSGKKKNKNRKR